MSVKTVEQRHNWKEDIGEAARKRAEKRLEIMSELETVRKELYIVDVRSPEYDQLKLKQRTLISELATI